MKRKDFTYEAWNEIRAVVHMEGRDPGEVANEVIRRLTKLTMLEDMIDSFFKLNVAAHKAKNEVDVYANRLIERARQY